MFSKIAKLKSHEQTLFGIAIVAGIVAVWRGLGGLMDLYLLPHDPTMSFSLSILIGLVILGATHYTVN